MNRENSKKISRRTVLQLLGGTAIGAAVPFGGFAISPAPAYPLPKPADDRRKIFFAYRSFWPEFEAMKRFRDAGVNTVCIFAAHSDNSLGMPYSKYPPVWRWFGKYDFGSLEKQYDDVLAINPDADFICMIDLNSPIWLERQLASECESFNMLSCACSNPAWVKVTGEYLEAVVNHMEKKYGDRVRAYLLACGRTDEWMDYSQHVAGRNKTRAWQNWLKNKGKSQVPVPSFERIDKAAFENLIRDPSQEQDIIDYMHFTGDIIADTVLNFAGKVRKLIPSHRQIGMFFGYILELTHLRLVSGGHLEYERLYTSPDIDFFLSPGTYSDRPMGGGSGFMIPNGTRTLNKKGFLHEIDHRTPTYNVNLDEYVSIGWMVPWKDQAETTAGLKREFALAIINHASLWCFDMWGGVFDPPETMKIVAQSKKIWDRFCDQPLKTRAEVALIADPCSARYLNDQNQAVSQIYTATRNKLNRLGAPFEVFSFDDIPSIDLTPYKLVIFPGLFEVTPERERMLNKFVFNNNRTVLFIYAAGISDGKNLEPSFVERLTGAGLKSPGIHINQREGWKSVYMPDYATATPASLKQVSAEAGVSIYCGEEVPVYANEKLIAIHVANGGQKTISLPFPAKKVRELYSEQEIAVRKGKFSYTFATPDTALFEVL